NSSLSTPISTDRHRQKPSNCRIRAISTHCPISPETSLITSLVMSPSTHLWLYQKIIGLYPAPYKQTYGQEMTYYFEDLLHDHGAAHTWIRVATELPSSLWQEYNSLYGDLMNITKREIIVIAVASLSFFIIPP